MSEAHEVQRVLSDAFPGCSFDVAMMPDAVHVSAHAPGRMSAMFEIRESCPLHLDAAVGVLLVAIGEWTHTQHL